MRKLFLCFAMIVHSVAYAELSCLGALNVVINNHTGEMCILIADTINNGSLIKERKLPTTIFANEKSQPIHLTVANTGPIRVMTLAVDIELSYQCGSKKFVTIESQKLLIRSDLPLNPIFMITGSASSLSNMDAKYSYTRGNCENNQSSTLEWTFY